MRNLGTVGSDLVRRRFHILQTQAPYVAASSSRTVRAAEIQGVQYILSVYRKWVGGVVAANVVSRIPGCATPFGTALPVGSTLGSALQSTNLIVLVWCKDVGCTNTTTAATTRITGRGAIQANGDKHMLGGISASSHRRTDLDGYLL